MPLKNIIEDVFGPLGLNPNVANDRTLLIAKINKAAQELWNANDLVCSLMERQFTVDTDEKELALPFYVGQPRGVRSTDYKSKVELVDQSPKYFYGRCYQDSLEFRIKPKVALQRSISNSAPMTISIPAAEVERITFTVSGSTANAHRTYESAVIEAGELSATLIKSFTDIKAFCKDIVTEGNCSLTDADDNEMAVIPNSLLLSEYVVLQVTDENLSTTYNGQTFDILFKQKFFPFVNNYDAFQAPDYDDAIGWKVLAHFYATKEDSGLGSNNAQIALGFAQQVDELITKRDQDATRGLKIPVQHYPNRFIRVMNRHGCHWR